MSYKFNYPDNYKGSPHTNGFVCPDSLNAYIKRAVKCMKTIKAPYDTIAFCGISGAIIGPLLAMKLKKEALLVRKNSDKRHSRFDVAGYEDVKSYIIVDDCIDSGATVKHIQKKIYEEYPEARCLGTVSVQELEPGAKDAEVYSTYCNLKDEELKKG